MTSNQTNIAQQKDFQVILYKIINNITSHKKKTKRDKKRQEKTKENERK